MRNVSSFLTPDCHLCVMTQTHTHNNNNKYNSFIKNNSNVIICYNAIFKVWGNRLHLLRERGKILSVLKTFSMNVEWKLRVSMLNYSRLEVENVDTTR